MVIRVDAELLQDTFSNHLNISYTLEENKKNNVAQDVSWSFCCWFSGKSAQLSQGSGFKPNHRKGKKRLNLELLPSKHFRGRIWDGECKFRWLVKILPLSFLKSNIDTKDAGLLAKKKHLKGGLMISFW